MNPIQTLSAAVKARFPDAQTTSDIPGKPTGTWFLDVKLGDHAIVIEWHPSRGFAISAGGEPGYGEKGDEVFADAESATQRVLALLLTRGRTVPPEAVRLRDLRTEFQLSQVELAERLSVNQAAVSKLENRTDMLVSTLQTVVSAMGGELVITARFPDGTERQLRFTETAPRRESSPAA